MLASVSEIMLVSHIFLVCLPQVPLTVCQIIVGRHGTLCALLLPDPDIPDIVAGGLEDVLFFPYIGNNDPN